MQKLEDIQNQNHPEVGHTHKESSETKKLKIHASTNWLGQNIGIWGSGTSQVPWESLLGPKFKIYVETNPWREVNTVGSTRIGPVG